MSPENPLMSGISPFMGIKVVANPHLTDKVVMMSSAKEIMTKRAEGFAETTKVAEAIMATMAIPKEMLDGAASTILGTPRHDGHILDDFLKTEPIVSHSYTAVIDEEKLMEKLIENSSLPDDDDQIQEMLDGLLDTFSTAGKHMDLKALKGDEHELRFELAEPCKLPVSLTGKGYRTRAFIGGEDMILESFRLGKKGLIGVFTPSAVDGVDLTDDTTRVEFSEVKARTLLPGFEAIYKWAIEKEEMRFIEASEMEREDKARIDAEHEKAVRDKLKNWGDW